MTLDELKQIVYKELPVNKDHLDTESLRNQELYAKFIDYKTNFDFLLAKAKGEYKVLYKDNAGSCYTYKSKKAECTYNAKDITIQE